MTWSYAVFFNKKLTVTFASEAEPRLFLACSQFLGKFEPCCSYESVFIKNKKKACNVRQCNIAFSFVQAFVLNIFSFVICYYVSFLPARVESTNIQHRSKHCTI